MNEVWIVDDDASIRWVLCRALEGQGYRVAEFSDALSALEKLTFAQPTALITDIRMPGMSGLELVEKIHKEYPKLPTIIMTAHTDLDSALASYKTGAFEYLPKPFDIDEAVALVARACEHVDTPNAASFSDSPHSELLGAAPAMQEVFRAIGRLARSHINVLICGESGTGKELVARALHQNSPRLKQPFIAINTAAIPAELLESELFGHEKGAFTGAVEKRLGRFEQSNGGTLFLDEIGDMPAELQTRLLRVLSDKRFYRLGGKALVEVDVRVVAATNQDLETRVKNGQFREDLYHRLNVIRIDLPPLRERVEDIPLLTNQFLNQSASELQVDRKHLSDSAIKRLCEFDWPGNVRQLENMCRWITVMAAGHVVSDHELPKEIYSVPASPTTERDWMTSLGISARKQLARGDISILPKLAEQFETTLIKAAVEHTRGHKQQAAKALGWGRNTLTRKLKDLRLNIRE